MEPFMMVLSVVLVLCSLVALYIWSQQPQYLPPSVIDKLAAFETRTKGMPVYDAVKLSSSYFPGWKVVTHDVTHGGQKLQKWLTYKPGKVDTVAIQYINGKVDNITLGPGEWEDPRRRSSPDTLAPP